MFDERLFVAIAEGAGEGAVVEVGGLEKASLLDIVDLAEHGSGSLGVGTSDVAVGIGQREVGGRPSVGDGTTKERESCQVIC